MRVYVTGGKGFLARNLIRTFHAAGHTVITDDDISMKIRMAFTPQTNEICVHRNSEDAWAKLFKSFEIDVVVHNAAIVGTDVVALDPVTSVLTNIQGTYNICRAANASGTAVCYLGTTVIYDVAEYQDSMIKEDSKKRPLTYYGVQKLAGEGVVMSVAKKWNVIRPLFAFGGDGDMNSMIAKGIYAKLKNKEKVDIFLNPSKIKDYLHASDFCAAVVLACSSPEGWMTDWNVAAETPMDARDVAYMLDTVSGENISLLIKWHSSADYLGNHRLSSQKIRENLGWKPALDLSEGIQRTVEWIRDADKSYNPLAYLEAAARRGTDLLQHFPRV
jgi:UDP-glucose 4-epimerase